MYKLRKLAALSGCISALDEVIKLTTGQHASHFCEQRLVLEAKKQLAAPTLPIREIAHKLDYEVSDFTKFFKRFTGVTPFSCRKASESAAQRREQLKRAATEAVKWPGKVNLIRPD